MSYLYDVCHKEVKTMNDESLNFARKIVSLLQSKRHMRVHPVSKSVACIQFEDGQRLFVIDYFPIKEKAKQIPTVMSDKACNSANIYG